MGYAVLHLEKAKGTDSRMSAHIERTVHPKNADRTRTHLNRELVQFPEGVRNRTQAIAHRIETAGIRRKVSANQVKAIRILLTGSNKDMKQMEAEGRIEGWCNDSLKWIREDTTHTRHSHTDSDRRAKESRTGRTEREKKVQKEEPAGRETLRR